MSTPSDPHANLKANLDRHRVEFMKSELALCLTLFHHRRPKVRNRRRGIRQKVAG